MQLLHKLHGAHDGTGHQLGEEAQVEAEVQEVPDGLDLPPLHVHDVAHRLEREKGNAHRQDDGVHAENIGPREHVQPFSQNVVDLHRQAEEVVHKVREEVRILEIRKNAQVHHYAESRKRRPSFLPLKPIQKFGSQEVIDDHKGQQGQEDAAGLVIEEQRDGKEIAVAQKRFGVNEGETGENQREERPEIELGEQ